MSQAQESIQIYLWGFIESRDYIPALVEAFGELTEEFAIMNSTERAMELGFSAREARETTSVFRGTDGTSFVEFRQVYLEGVDVNGTHVLFEEANDLAEAAAQVLAAFDGTSTADSDPLERLGAALAAYDQRWEITRG